MLYEAAAGEVPERNRAPRICRYNGRPPVDDRRMENPLLGQEPLPQFLKIRPEHVEPAVRELLLANRARLEALAAVDRPTFASVVEPLEELHHRTSRTWSPVSHLNAVLNSEALRASYNACLPLLSAYYTDLAQSEPLFQAYRHVSEEEGARLAPVQRQLIEHRVRDFRLAGVGLTPERKERFKTAMLELSQLQAKFEENVLDATNGWTHQVTELAQLAGLNEMLIEQARARAAEQRLDGWLLTLDQPTYVAVVTDAESRAAAARLLRGLVHARLGPGPQRRRWDNSQVMEDILQAPARGRAAAGFRQLRRVRARHAHGAQRGRGARVPARAGGAAPRRRPRPSSPSSRHFAGRKLSAWDVGFYAERLQRERYNVSQEELRAVLPAAARARRAVRGRREALRRAHPRAPRRPGVAPGCALLRRSPARAVTPSAASTWMPTRAPTSAAARGWTSASAASTCHREPRLPVAYLVCNFLPPAGERPALLTHDDVRDAVPRVRPRAASPAHARRLSEHRRHQRRGLGRGRAAEPVHGELCLAPGRAAAHLRHISQAARRCRRSSSSA